MWHKLLLLATLSISACDGGVSVRARVLEHNGAPISGAIARVHTPGGYRLPAVLSDDRGCLDYGQVMAWGRYPVPFTVDKAGFDTFVGTVMTIDHNFLIVTLSPNNSGPPSTARVVSEAEMPCERDSGRQSLP